MSLLTNAQIRSRVLSIFPDFVSDVDPNQLCDHLIANKIIDTTCWKRIVAKKNTQEDQCRGLLHHLDSITNQRTFLVVLKALKRICPHIYDQIERQSDTETGDANEISAVQKYQIDRLKQNRLSVQELFEKLGQERDEARRLNLLNELRERYQAMEAETQKMRQELNESKERSQVVEAALREELNECKKHLQAMKVELQRSNEERDALEKRLEEKFKKSLQDEIQKLLQTLAAKSPPGNVEVTENESEVATTQRGLDTPGKLKKTKDKSKVAKKKQGGDTAADAPQPNDSAEKSDVRNVSPEAKQSKPEKLRNVGLCCGCIRGS